jgi:hypothetical protein
MDNPKELDEAIGSLRAAWELKEKGGLSEEDYSNIKRKFLSRSVSTPSAPVGTGLFERPEPQTAADQAAIALYAGDLHRTMVRVIERSLPGPEKNEQQHMMDSLSKLVELNALVLCDMPSLTSIVDTVCDSSFGAKMPEGLAKISTANNELKLNPQSSTLAKTISGIAHDSALNAVLESQPGQPNAQQGASLWGAVKMDVWGSLNGGAAVATILQLAPLHTAAATLAAVLGPVGWLGATFGALVGAAVESGRVKRSVS